MKTDESTWVRFNSETYSYETKDGTTVAAEVVDNCNSLLDVLNVSIIRERQRKREGLNDLLRMVRKVES